MTRQRTLPSLREQARHALLLLGVPVPARLLVEVHTAFFDGDLSVPALVALLRDEERAHRATPPPYVICPGLNPDLTAVRSTVTLSTWDISDRLGTPAVSRAHQLAATVRVAEFAAARRSASAGASALLRRLAQDIPGGPEAVTHAATSHEASALAAAAREALEAPALAAAAESEEPIRAEALARAEHLDDHQRLFGLPAVPHQRGHP